MSQTLPRPGTPEAPDAGPAARRSDEQTGGPPEEPAGPRDPDARSPFSAESHRRLHGQPRTDPPRDAGTLLRSREIRVTVARRAVVDILLAEHEHLSADEVAARLSHRGIHRATVYRTLETLSGAGVLAHRQLPGGAGAYHLASDDHLHGYCTQCQSVLALPPDTLESAAELLRRTTGFRLDAQRSTLSGLCPKCASS